MFHVISKVSTEKKVKDLETETAITFAYDCLNKTVYQKWKL